MDEVPSEAKTEAKVITVTLNPSLDRTLVTHFLAVGYHNRTTGPTRLDPAVRGVSVSRALYALGVPTHAIILLGRDATGRSYQSLLAEEQFPITILRREGTTRSNIDIKDTGHNHETIVLEESTGVEQAHLEMVADMIQQLVAPGDRVVFAGSVPEGVRTDVYAWLTTVAQTAGARVAINAGGGESLRAFHARVEAALRLLVGKYPSRIVVAVAHGGVLDCAYRIASGLPLDAPRGHALLNASLNRIEFDGTRFALGAWAEVSHLDEALDDA